MIPFNVFLFSRIFLIFLSFTLSWIQSLAKCYTSAIRDDVVKFIVSNFLLLSFKSTNRIVVRMLIGRDGSLMMCLLNKLWECDLMLSWCNLLVSGDFETALISTYGILFAQIDLVNGSLWNILMDLTTMSFRLHTIIPIYCVSSAPWKSIKISYFEWWRNSKASS